MSDRDWRRIAGDYETARVTDVSLDALIEWPAEQRVVGPVEGLSVLDLGCGSGRKSIWFAEHGARRVLGVDIVDSFEPPAAGVPAEFLVGDLSDVRILTGGERFDLVTILQAIGYARDERALWRDLATLVSTGGQVVVARSHPIRWAVERSRAESIPLGVAYRQVTPFTYPASWGVGTVTHRTFTFAETLSPALEAGFTLEHVEEPPPTDHLRALSPQRAMWMDEHVGLLLYRFRVPDG